ncbi:MAG: hypothetical protein SGJ00_03110, partial [bacterium]|nr:hypothetical protein [bacterium]
MLWLKTNFFQRNLLFDELNLRGYNRDLVERDLKNPKFREHTIENINQLIKDEDYHCRSKNGFPG